MIRQALAKIDDAAALPKPGLVRFELVAGVGDPGWPGLIVRLDASGANLVARVSTVDLARRIADVLDRLAEADARRPKSVIYWLRGI